MAKKKTLSEKEIEKQILTYLNYLPGVFAFKVNTTGIFDPTTGSFRKNRNPFVVPGTADILGVIHPGRFLAIEVKTPNRLKLILNTKRPTKADLQQRAFLENIKKRGGIAFYADSIESVKTRLIEEKLLYVTPTAIRYSLNC